ncbi:hypothetical protein ACH5RR_008695 [Cinchona calisaya]|uniref:Uncharacterized protein n=1 Tax=Cinchona calisaya TaxID=153742 RepID=A0ABD3ADZ5_9GENT
MSGLGLLLHHFPSSFTIVASIVGLDAGDLQPNRIQNIEKTVRGVNIVHQDDQFAMLGSQIMYSDQLEISPYCWCNKCWFGIEIFPFALNFPVQKVCEKNNGVSSSLENKSIDFHNEMKM